MLILQIVLNQLLHPEIFSPFISYSILIHKVSRRFNAPALFFVPDNARSILYAADSHSFSFL